MQNSVKYLNKISHSRKKLEHCNSFEKLNQTTHIHAISLNQKFTSLNSIFVELPQPRKKLIKHRKCIVLFKARNQDNMEDKIQRKH